MARSPCPSPDQWTPITALHACARIPTCATINLGDAENQKSAYVGLRTSPQNRHGVPQESLVRFEVRLPRMIGVKTKMRPPRPHGCNLDSCARRLRLHLQQGSRRRAPRRPRRIPPLERQIGFRFSLLSQSSCSSLRCEAHGHSSRPEE